MTNLEIPPCGPERDRLVAEAVGWEFFTLGGKSWCSIGVTGRAMLPSQSDSDALAALEAWADAAPPGEDRGYTLHRHGTGRRVVELWQSKRRATYGHGDTLRDAATAALVRWRNERSQS